MPTNVKFMSNPSACASIAAALEADPLSGDILRFLLKNENAMDSAKGIAAWWLHRDELAVQPSLHRLFASGAIVAHMLSSGTAIYGLTPDPDVRAWLRNVLTHPDDPCASPDRQTNRRKVSIGVSTT
jgi:hypothetical protein